MFRLETERLVIRPWSPDERAVYASIVSDPEVTRYINAGRAFTDQDMDDWLARQARQLAEHGVCFGAIAEKASGRLVGTAGMQPLGTTGHLEIGWILGREGRGKGYATEAGEASMRHVLETLGRERVVAIIDPGNLASKRVAARLGMTLEGRYTGAQLGHRRPEIIVDLFFRLREPSQTPGNEPKG